MERIQKSPVARLPLVHVLNLPDANICEKRKEQVKLQDGTTRQACLGCVTQEFHGGRRMRQENVIEIISYFAKLHGTGVLTINGRGDPFHPRLKQMTLDKIMFASSFGIRSYVFTAGQNLDSETCRILAECGTNVMISLFGNQFLDAEFFQGRQYSESPPLQNEAEIAHNLRTLIEAYHTFGVSMPRLIEDTTRIGMNYVVSESDLKDGGAKLRALKEAAEANGIFFICNTEFHLDPNSEKYHTLKALARENSSFNLEHSTADERGQCMVGAGAAVTIDYDGTMFRCPYMNGKGDGHFLEMDDAARENVISTYLQDVGYACALRKTPLRGYTEPNKFFRFGSG